MKSYLFTYSQPCTQAQAHEALNDTEGVQTWVAPFPYSAILVSTLDTQDLCSILRNQLPNVWFMVSEMDPQNVDGWLPRELWSYVTDLQKAWSRQLLKNIAARRHLRRPAADTGRMAGM